MGGEGDTIFLRGGGGRSFIHRTHAQLTDLSGTASYRRAHARSIELARAHEIKTTSGDVKTTSAKSQGDFYQNRSNMRGKQRSPGEICADCAMTGKIHVP